MITVLFPEGELLLRSTQLPQQHCQHRRHRQHHQHHQHRQHRQHHALLLEGQCPPGVLRSGEPCNRQGRNKEWQNPARRGKAASEQGVIWGEVFLIRSKPIHKVLLAEFLAIATSFVAKKKSKINKNKEAEL